MLRKLIQGDHFPLFFRGKLGYQLSVDIKDAGGECRIKVGKLLIVFQIMGKRQRQSETDSGYDGKENDEKEKDSGNMLFLASHSYNKSIKVALLQEGKRADGNCGG